MITLVQIRNNFLLQIEFPWISLQRHKFALQKMHKFKFQINFQPTQNKDSKIGFTSTAETAIAAREHHQQFSTKNKEASSLRNIRTIIIIVFFIIQQFLLILRPLLLLFGFHSVKIAFKFLYVSVLERVSQPHRWP